MNRLFFVSDFFLTIKRIYQYFFWNFKGVRISYNSNVSTKATLEECSFFDNSFVGSEAKVYKKTYGNNVYIQHAEIGEYCSLAPGCKIGLEEHDLNNYSTHPSTYDSKKFLSTKKKVKIGNHVWIGTNAVILMGVSVGENAVIAAGAVVNKDVPDGEIWGGVPAKLLKKRY